MSETEKPSMLAYQDSCSGPTMLLIHGFPLNSNLWEPQLEDLPDVARLLAPDLRGHGLSETGDDPVTMALMADDCMGLLDALGIQDPVIVCGLSMGGYVAFEFYRRFPEWVEALILVSTRAQADSAEGRAGRDQMIELVEAEGAEAVADRMVPMLLSPDNYREGGDLATFVREMIETASDEGLIAALEAMKERPDSTPTLAKIKVPTLIIHGADDQLVPPADALAMQQAIPGARLEIVEQAGHLPNLEQPVEFNEIVWDFVESLS